MNTRTNTRNWRQSSTYYVIVDQRRTYINASVEAIATGAIAKIALGASLEELAHEIGGELYRIEFDRDKGITSPEAAAAEAIRQFNAQN